MHDTTMSEPHGTPESHSEKDHAPDAHGAATGHAEGAHSHDDHMHPGMGLGPFDLRMWAVGVVGVIWALIITAGFVAATGFQFNA
jgi:ABC-type Zn2+ transport system substrate-binding protein/surface adhesin